MITMPLIFFAAGSNCLYDAYQIFKTHQLQKEIQTLLEQTKIFGPDKSYEEKQRIADELNEILMKDED